MYLDDQADQGENVQERQKSRPDQIYCGIVAARLNTWAGCLDAVGLQSIRSRWDWLLAAVLHLLLDLLQSGLLELLLLWWPRC